MARIKLAVALALAGAITAPSAQALGLGTIEVRSALNQPLDARIPLLPADEGELETLVVSLASTMAFQRAGVDRPFSLTRLQFTVVRDDPPYVRVTTVQPVKEPFLDFLVQADWDRGRLVREFTLLLDPPIYAGSGRAPLLAAAPLASSRSASGLPSQVAPPVAVAGAASAPTAPPAEASTASFGPVGANDTLWKIANQLRPSEAVSVNQVMIALLRANPDAFIAGDINRLRRGSVLQLPELAQIAGIDALSANQEVQAQMQRWRQATAAAAQPRGRLQVVAPPEPSVPDSETASPKQAAADRATLESLRQELQGYRESNVSLQAENDDLKAQVEGLKQELAHFERLLSLSVQQPALTPAADVGPAEMEAEAEQPSQIEAEQAAQTEAAAAEQEAAAEQPQPTAARQPVPVAPPAKEPGFFDEPSNLTTLGGVAAALLGVLYLLMRRRRKAGEAAEEALAMPLPEEAESEAEPQPAAAKLAQSADTADEQQELAAAEDEADALDDLPVDNDPLSEAEVYLAYGRYDQARELLETALEQDPEHTGLRLKLLETLALVQDEDSFIVHARLLRGQVSDQDETWLRAQEMGREFLPEEPLFFAEAVTPAAAAPVAAEEEPSFDLDFDLGGITQTKPAAEEPAAPATEALQAAVAADDFSLDFELPEPLLSQQAEPEQQLDEAGLGVLDTSSSLGLVDTPSLTESAGPGLEDLSFGETTEAAAAADKDGNVLDFSLPADDDDAPGAAEPDSLDDLDDLDEVGIKLNLARAYLDMGDGDGARSLIDEVLAEGSSRQRQEAEGLLQQLA